MNKTAQVATSNADVLINATEVASVESQNDNNMNGSDGHRLLSQRKDNSYRYH